MFGHKLQIKYYFLPDQFTTLFARQLTLSNKIRLTGSLMHWDLTNRSISIE
ncbi:hypothetical protein PCASD_11297 [Puccinia coronata f. sp. avenae]|uniref:Uncharacterized protein n=1 Tax=Puccinia coronata f. sp. avenae TaxID=200324 RepID=A0A2N5UJ55_9BASI|nr:hypothetical protein PCASD_11297 [Puccinia coronata f. sp. avenae]